MKQYKVLRYIAGENLTPLEVLLNEGWVVTRVDVIPGIDLKHSALRPSAIYILEREAQVK